MARYTKIQNRGRSWWLTMTLWDGQRVLKGTESTKTKLSTRRERSRAAIPPSNHKFISNLRGTTHFKQLIRPSSHALPSHRLHGLVVLMPRDGPGRSDLKNGILGKGPRVRIVESVWNNLE